MKKLIKQVKELSRNKNEPKWMLEKRIEALEIFLSLKMPNWGADLSSIDFQKYCYYQTNKHSKSRRWSDVPKEMRQTFDKLGLLEAEKRYLAGLGAQAESEMIYHNLKKDWQARGVIFCDTDTALRENPDLFKRYFATIVPARDNKFAALNTAFWSGGSFLYVPKGIKLTVPVQAYFRISQQNLAQFERTLIIAEANSEVQYVEGCSAPAFSTNNLHAGVVEVFVHQNAHVRYTTIQNWSKNVVNLVTKRAVVHKNGFMEWIDGNFGSGKTMKYPSSYLIGQGARTEILSLSHATANQEIDSGSKVYHLASETSSIIKSRSISSRGGRSTFRSWIEVATKAKKANCYVSCQGLILDSRSQVESRPVIRVGNNQAQLDHEAKISSIDEDRLFYLRSRGLSANEATSLIVNGFLSPIVKTLPMEYAVEINRLIEINIDKTVI